MKDIYSYYNQTVDISYGLICIFCFLIGTLGNVVSFVFFKTKNKDVSTVIYMLITGNDVLISIAVLPVGISFWSQRQPGILLGSKYGCYIWIYWWNITVSLSFFLVICLSITRTISLVRPFLQQKVKYVLMGVIAYTALTIAHVIVGQVMKGIKISFSVLASRCVISVDIGTQTPYFLGVSKTLTFIAPLFIVAISCVISVSLLTKRNKTTRQRELQQSRNKATVTILLFALLYGVCTLPLVVDYLVKSYSLFQRRWDTSLNFYKFDRKHYYRSAVRTLLIAVNSALNPIFYIWRMPRLRVSVFTKVREILRLARNLMRERWFAEEVRPNVEIRDVDL